MDTIFSFGKKSMVLYLFLFGNIALAQAQQTISNTWKKYGLENTQLYLFRFSEPINNQNLSVKVFHQKFKNLSERMYLNGERITRKNEFVYVAKSTNLLYGQKLPFFLPANTWVLAFNYSDQYLLVDDASKIEISLKNKSLINQWQLPETFDMRRDIALSFQQYLSSNAKDIDNLYITRFSLSEKVDPAKTTRDTILTYSLKKIPKGIAMLLPDLDMRAHANQEVTLTNVLFYHKELFFSIPTQPVKKPLPTTKTADACFRKMTDVNGNIGFADGCITGMGSGKCMGILQSKDTKKYTVTIIIEPN
ncbi:hypothetical protein [Pedobacter sp. Hv1]|uniref:hypothetical protein n=1 Tax=Pedobacter sp. Hv1 TaxID=1740090 RepID=UPI0006D89C97|nr:hypothetical protein [Pedobacter sp. Hv1]KQB98861.1 hypothetical protein AQF98_21215 [Pedobacter sp. Hv1]